MGIPVYRNPGDIEDDLEITVGLSRKMDAVVNVGIQPMDFTDIFENIELDYEGDDGELIFNNEDEKTVSLEVNGPVSLIFAMATSPDDDNVQTASFIFGLLLTSDVQMQVTTDDDMIPGGRHQLDIASASGDPKTTYGIVMHESWMDLNSFDTSYITSMMFGEMGGEVVEPEAGDVAGNMNTIIYGEDATALADIPILLWEDDFYLLTITDVQDGSDHKFGVAFTNGEAGGPQIDSLNIEVLTADPEANATIELQVTSDGSPVEGADVVVSKGGAVIITLTTDAQGKAEFSVVDAGTYHLLASKAYYNQDQEDVTVKSEGQAGNRLDIDLPDDFEDSKEFTVTIKNRTTGLPLENVSVTIYSGITPLINQITDANGQVKFTMLEGSYTVKAEHPDYITEEKQIVVDAADDDDDGEDDFIPGFGIVGVLLCMSAAILLFSFRKK